MSYWNVAQLSEDGDLRTRITACAALENISNPEAWAYQNRWHLAAQPGWGDAYEYALNLGNPAPGRDPAVITDGMILSAVQSIPNPN